MRKFVQFEKFSKISAGKMLLLCLLILWPGLGLSQNRAGVELPDKPNINTTDRRHFLPEQPQLLKFKNGAELSKYNMLKWTKIFDRTTGKEAKYLVAVIDPDTNKMIASKKVPANQCSLKQVFSQSDLTDKKKYFLQVIAYQNSVEEIYPQQRTQHEFILNKYPRREIVPKYEYTGKLISPQPGMGVSTAGGVLLKWEPELENHQWSIRIIKIDRYGTTTIVAYLKEALPRSERRLVEGMFQPEDEDCRVEVNITSGEGMVTPIQTYFYINNINTAPNTPLFEKDKGHILVWQGRGDPDNEQVIYRLIVEREPTGADTEPQLIQNIVVPSSGKMDLLNKLDRMVEHTCYILAEDKHGLARRSKSVVIMLEPSPQTPQFKVKTDRKKLAKAKKIILVHENFDKKLSYKYYSKFFLKDGKTLPSGNRWYSERPTKTNGNKVEFDLRVTDKDIEKIAVSASASNGLGESVESTRIITKKAKRK